LKIAVIGNKSSLSDLSGKTALANLAMAKIAVSFITLEEKKVFLVGDEGVLEIIRDALSELLKAPTIMISFEEKKEERKILSDEYLKFVSFVVQPKIVHIRSPCIRGFLINKNPD
jgi:hypothetical protein